MPVSPDQPLSPHSARDGKKASAKATPSPADRADAQEGDVGDASGVDHDLGGDEPAERPVNTGAAGHDANGPAEWIVADFGRALMLLSRIPWPARLDFQSGLIARSVWCWPLVGVFLAGIAVLPAQALLWLTGNAGLAAVFALLAMVGLTGALHEDGLADCGDGFGGGATRERKLEIMRDSRIGSYGVVALILAFAARFFVLEQAIEQGVFMMVMIVTAMFSRLAMPAMMAILPPARPDGLGRGAGRPGLVPLMVALLFTVIITMLVAGPVLMLGALLAMGLACGVVGLVAYWQIGGQSGDVLGCSQIVAEIFVAISLLSLLAKGLV
ncbi:adenosylcobinamide-GDP ribazoletransferase [Thalassospira marina]|uniref:Adenosylcobinamide-GDP ribazoletransferase n=1 Tax=Thalassospira marina TaxID=2048283 RepID=A0ABM6QDV3_9PROT|nr:adenosylcobinamide-GDP ribazoletransferase [Thalassospira marina]